MRHLRTLAVLGAAGLVLAAATTAAAAPAAATATTTTLASPAMTAGTPATLTATVSPKPSGGTVKFASDGVTLTGCSARALSGAKATCSATLPAGPHTLTAKYSGVASAFAASTGTKKVTVKAHIVGSLGACTTSSGALVAVGFGHWNGPVVRGCDPNPTTGINLLTTAGFTTVGTQHDGPQFICRIGHPLFNSGTQYPTSAEDACVNTPPANAYWSYWLALKGHNTWSYSPLGAYSDQPKAGEVEAWTYGSTDISGTTGQPAFTPNQVRAGLPSATAAADRGRQVAADTPDRADLGAAVGYLTGQLVDGTHYEPFGGGFGDFGLTMDGALALAATGTADSSLRAIVDFLDQGGKDGAGRTVDDYTGIGTKYVSGGAIAKEALTAEAAGYDPRAFGGHDLIATLDDLVCAKAVENECAAAGNYTGATSTFGQALGVIAQLRAGDTTGAAQPIAYLESLQQDSGAFPSVLPGSDSEVDSTGMAAMALALVDTDRARSAVRDALDWIAGQQNGDGGFPGAAGNSVNSAALAIQALGLDAGEYDGPIADGNRFLAMEQNSDGGFNVAVGAESIGSDVRASTQATGAVVGTPFGSVLDNLDAKAAADQGADYLVSQLVDGDHYVFTGTTFADQGLTADGLFGLLATGGHDDAVAAMKTYLEGQVDNYADPTAQFGGPYSGALAKLSLVAEATGVDPHAYGGYDLLKILTDHVCAAATDDGACTAAGDFVSSFSSISQSLGILALQASSDGADHLAPDSAPVTRLLQLQCADGGFTSELIAPGAECTSDVDATGYAVQALTAVALTGEALGRAEQYQQSVQKDSGLYHGTAGDNSNSTALAADGLQAMRRALQSPTGRNGAADSRADTQQVNAVAPIATLQRALSGLLTLSVSSGGFGITSNDTADLRSSTQAVAAAAQVSLLDQSGATVLSAPWVTADITPPPTSPPPTSPSSGAPGSAGSTSAGGGPGGLANTGAAAGPQLGWAVLLLIAGAGLAFAGRRRIAVVVGRHRSAPKHR